MTYAQTKSKQHNVFRHWTQHNITKGCLKRDWKFSFPPVFLLMYPRVGQEGTLIINLIITPIWVLIFILLMKTTFEIGCLTSFCSVKHILISMEFIFMCCRVLSTAAFALFIKNYCIIYWCPRFRTLYYDAQILLHHTLCLAWSKIGGKTTTQ